MRYLQWFLWWLIRQEATQSIPSEAGWEWRIALTCCDFLLKELLARLPHWVRGEADKTVGEVHLGEEDWSIPLVGVKRKTIGCDGGFDPTAWLQEELICGIQG